MEAVLRSAPDDPGITSDGGPAGTPRPAGGLAPLDHGLYVTTLVVWGTSWIALSLQLGVVAPEVSLVWRFAISAVLMFVWVAAIGARWRFPLADHLRFALVGALMFSTNFALFYYGASGIPSGLLSVVFSLASVVNVLMAAVFLRMPMEPRVLAGAGLGVLGIALMFWPEIGGAQIDMRTAKGLLLCVAGTCCFCLGNMVSASNQRRGLPVIPANAWGMLYGTLLLTAVALVAGRPFIVEWTVAYLGSLAWLAVASSVVAFAAYLTLLGRIGPQRAGYLTVMFPVVALAISTAFEGYVWTWPAALGLALVLGGNLLVLRAPRAG